MKPAVSTIIKKYPNRRLYNTATSVYVTLDDLRAMVKDGEDFTVQDAKSGEDLTRAVLTQIILEQEAGEDNLLPLSFLKQLIGFYGDQMQPVLSSYLEQALEQFQDNQDQIKSYLTESLGPQFGSAITAPWEELTRRNVAMVGQAMRNMTQMFFPFPVFGPSPDSSSLTAKPVIQDNKEQPAKTTRRRAV